MLVQAAAEAWFKAEYHASAASKAVSSATAKVREMAGAIAWLTIKLIEMTKIASTAAQTLLATAKAGSKGGKLLLCNK